MQKCLYPRCPANVRSGYCQDHQRARRRDMDKTRRDDPNRELYRTERWKQTSRRHLMMNPWCVGYPRGYHKVGVIAQCTDHIQSARTHPELFWEPSNHQSFCFDCNRRKAIAEEGGFGASRYQPRQGGPIERPIEAANPQGSPVENGSAGGPQARGGAREGSGQG